MDGMNIALTGLIPGAREIYAPRMDALQAWHYTRGSAEEAAHNWAPKGPRAQIIGSPDFSDPGFMEIDTNVDFMRLGVADTTPGLTWMATFKNSDTLASAANQPVFMSTYTGVAGAMMWISGMADMGADPLPEARLRAQVVSSAVQALAVNVLNVGEMRIGMLRVWGAEAGDAMAVKELIEGVNFPTTLLDTRQPSGRLIEVGGYVTGAFAGKGKLGQIGAWGAPLTDPEAVWAMSIVQTDMSYAIPPEE